MKQVKIYNPKLASINTTNIGTGTKIHPFVVIQPGVTIGKNCKIQSFVFIPEGITIEDGVFIGPHVCFTNDKYPRAVSPNWTLTPSRVKKGASIGAGAIILPGVTIGKHALIGAGSVVTRDVPDLSIVVGNPARIVGTSNDASDKK